MIGTLVLVTQATAVGHEVILGSVVKPLWFEERNGQEEITHVTVEGQVIATHINGLPLPIITEQAIKLELVPVVSRHPGLIRLKVL